MPANAVNVEFRANRVEDLGCEGVPFTRQSAGHDGGPERQEQDRAVPGHLLLRAHR